MTPAEALVACEAIVRRADPDRYFAALFAPADRRPLLYALYALNHELARAGEVSHEPVTAEIRLQWWLEAAEEAAKGKPRAHPVGVGLAEAFSRSSLDLQAVQALIVAREAEISFSPFATLAAMESHAGATSASLMRAAAPVLDVTGMNTDLISEAGIAYGLVGMLRSIPSHGARGNLFLPLDFLMDESLTASEALSGKHALKLKRVVGRTASRAFDHFQRAREIGISPGGVPIVLPAALVPAYLSRLAKCPDPLRHSGEISQLRRQLIFLRAAVQKRL